MSLFKYLFALLAVLPVFGCDGGGDAGTSGSGTGSSAPVKAGMKLTSSAFEDQQTIPAKFSGKGDDVSPPLAWSGAPDNVKSFAIIVDDPDAPLPEAPREEGPWVHWVLYNLPPQTASLPEGVPRVGKIAEPIAALQGMNDFFDDNVGYRGPMPPPGSPPHRYIFRIYALDQMLDLDHAGTTKADLIEAMQGHILDQGELVGNFAIDS